MWIHEFSALGTRWHLSVDGLVVSPLVTQEIEKQTQDFEKKFSRFIPNNEVTNLRTAAAGTHTISEEFSELLLFAQTLKEKSNGAFDPAVGSLLEHAGYNQTYSFTQNTAALNNWRLPNWKLSGTQLTIEGPILFDLGGFAKGYWIDQVSNLLKKSGYKNHLVDGGGDMFATTKADGSSWRIAIEYPGRTDTAIGTVQLNNQGFAASDVFRRSWKDWHHLVDIQKKRPQKSVLGAVAIAPSAMEADGMTALLSLSPPETYPQYYSLQNACEYLVIAHSNALYISPGWNGDIFA